MSSKLEALLNMGGDLYGAPEIREALLETPTTVAKKKVIEKTIAPPLPSQEKEPLELREEKEDLKLLLERNHRDEYSEEPPLEIEEEIEFTAQNNTASPKWANYEPMTTRLDPKVIRELDDLVFKTTRSRRKRIAGQSLYPERLTKNSFLRGIVSAFIGVINEQEVDFSTCLTENDLHKKLNDILKGS